MKKLLIGIGIFILLNITTAYIFLFTSFGNGLVASYAEKTVNAKEPINFKIEEFSLTFSNLKLKASIDTTSIVEVMGDISPLSLEFDLDYLVDIKDLSKLEQFAGQKLKGNFKTNGEVKGNKDLLLVNGLTDVFESNSKYDVVLKNFVVTNVDLLFKGINIDKVLYTVNQPQYATGKIDIEGNITDITLENLAGNVTTTIYDGTLNNPIINEAFNLKLLNAKLFSGNIETLLNPMLVDNKIDFKTSFANLAIQSAKIDLKDMSINSDYKATVEDLNNLFDLTQTKLLGNLLVDGTVKKAKDLEVTGKTNTLNGLVDFKLFNDDFSANIANIEVVELTKMLMYPSFFDSSANANLKYNIATSNGEVTATLANGQFLPNEFSSLINTFAQFDITKEVYEKVALNSLISKDDIQSKINMKSTYTTIDVPNSIVKLKEQTTDTTVNLGINNYVITTYVTGNLNDPNIKVDASKLLEDKAKEKLNEEKEKLENKVQEKLKEKLGEDTDTGKILDGIKSIFN